MKKEDLRVVYMGTPDFAVEVLHCLAEGGYGIVGVITMPDKPTSRGHEVQYSLVKQHTLDHQLSLSQPEKLKDVGFVQALRGWKADLQIAVTSRTLPEVVWNMSRLEIFNLRASLLPQCRGVAPINWVAISGDTEMGITTSFLKHEAGTGEVIQRMRVPITDTDSMEVVHGEPMRLGGRLVIETVDVVLEGNIKAIPQEEMAVIGKSRPVPRIPKETCRTNWNQPVKRVYDFIRELPPYPAAWSESLNPEDEAVVMKIPESEKEEKAHTLTSGSVITDGEHFLKVAVSDGFVSILSLQLPSKKRLKIDELLHGSHPAETFRMKVE